MSIIFDFNYINVRIPNRHACDGGEPPLGGRVIYTDGSKMDEGIGAGVLFPNSMIKHNCSMFQAEIK